MENNNVTKHGFDRVVERSNRKDASSATICKKLLYTLVLEQN